MRRENMTLFSRETKIEPRKTFHFLSFCFFLFLFKFLSFLYFYFDNFISASNGNPRLSSVTNNNHEPGSDNMKRQSSLQSTSSPPMFSKERERAGSEADATMTSLTGSYPTTAASTAQSTPVHSSTVPASPFR